MDKQKIEALKIDIAKGLNIPKEELFGKKNTTLLTGAEVSKIEFMKTLTPEQIEAIKKEIKIKLEEETK